MNEQKSKNKIDMLFLFLPKIFFLARWQGGDGDSNTSSWDFPIPFGLFFRLEHPASEIR
jgi:hypothetical protein